MNNQFSYLVRNQSQTPAVPLPNPGEGGVAAPGNGEATAVPLPSFGEGEATDPGNGNQPSIMLPNPGEGGTIYPGNENRPVTLLPNPGEGGPVDPGNGNRPVIPLPNPGEGGPVAPGGINLPTIIGTIITGFPRPNQPCNFCGRPNQSNGNVRILNAAAGYNPFSIYVNSQLFVSSLDNAELTGYEKVPSSYQMISVMGDNGYIYVQKPVYVPVDEAITIAVVNSETGLDLFSISDTPCRMSNYVSCLRACNLSYNSGPLNVVVGDNELVFPNVGYQEVTNYRIVRPGEYVFYVSNSRQNILLSSTVNVQRNVSYTIYMFNWNAFSPVAVRVLIVEEHF